jgi:hypothetical protein
MDKLNTIDHQPVAPQAECNCPEVCTHDHENE